MRNTVLISIFLFAILSGCEKNKFGSTPTLKFKSVNTTQLRTGQLLQFTLSFTDKEGDLADSIFVQKIVPDCPGSNFEDLHQLPSFPTTKNSEGDFIITYGFNADPYQNVSPKCSRNDTAVFRFALKDKAQHVSDTVSSPTIIIYY